MMVTKTVAEVMLLHSDRPHYMLPLSRNRREPYGPSSSIKVREMRYKTRVFFLFVCLWFFPPPTLYITLCCVWLPMQSKKRLTIFAVCYTTVHFFLHHVSYSLTVRAPTIYHAVTVFLAHADLQYCHHRTLTFFQVEPLTFGLYSSPLKLRKY